MVEWYNGTLPTFRPGFNSRSAHSISGSLRIGFLAFRKRFSGNSEKYVRGLKKLVDCVDEKSVKVLWKFFERKCNLSGLTEKRKLKYTFPLRYFYSLKGDLSKINQSSVEEFFLWIKNSKYSPDTKKDYWDMFKIFAEFVNPKIDVRKYRLLVKKRRKLPEDILSQDEIVSLLEATIRIRDKAIISVLYESGCRVGELVGLRIKDVIFDDYGAVLRVNGKTGMRRVRIIKGVLSIEKQIAKHVKKKEKADSSEDMFLSEYYKKELKRFEMAKQEKIKKLKRKLKSG